jgi:hypothetical protein
MTTSEALRHSRIQLTHGSGAIPSLEQLREIVAVAPIEPAVVQVESHPYLPEWELLDFCREQGIVLLRSQRRDIRWNQKSWTAR